MAIKYDSANCTGCGNCLEYCNGNAFEPERKYAVKFNSDLCLQCDECEASKNCLGDAITYV